MSRRILVATRKGLFTLSRESATNLTPWSVADAAFLGDNVTYATRDARDGTLYAALHHGHFGEKLHRSEDDGKSWTECAVPTYPERPSDAPPDPPNAMGKAAPWSLQLLWMVQPGGDDQPNLLWAGTIPGGLFRSADCGSSWELVRSLWDRPERLEWFGGGYDYPGIHSVLVDPRNSKHVLVGVSCGGAWLTEDGGETWQCRADGMRAEYMPPERAGDPNIQDPHIIVRCPSKPDCLWAQHHNGIFKSTDNGRLWTEITNVSPSAFGFAVVVHPHDADTAWFVPAVKDETRIPVDGRLVVTRTRDGGKTFDQLTNGLPQSHAYDLIFRHALDLDETGNRLVFGSTTGSVWTSDDQGDSWTGVTNHLPPIHSTRFID